VGIACLQEPRKNGCNLMLTKLRKILGALTDALNIGRSKGWWSKRNGPNVPGGPK
jgi:hypothetical protein